MLSLIECGLVFVVCCCDVGLVSYVVVCCCLAFVDVCPCLLFVGLAHCG